MEEKSKNKSQTNESVWQKLWLMYYNDTLYEKGVITEAERDRMRAMINNRKCCA